jgi:secondary thiamine-phosphate synthase enzyme
MFIQINREIETKTRREIIDITKLVTEIISKNKDIKGLVNIYTPHTTACITINEYEKDLKKDIIETINSIAPIDGDYHHQVNADAHIVSSIIKPSTTIPFKNGSLNLGTYQRILFLELDGPRNREIKITLMST